MLLSKFHVITNVKVSMATPSTGTKGAQLGFCAPVDKHTSPNRSGDALRSTGEKTKYQHLLVTSASENYKILNTLHFHTTRSSCI